MQSLNFTWWGKDESQEGDADFWVNEHGPHVTLKFPNFRAARSVYDLMSSAHTAGFALGKRTIIERVKNELY
jgi:hypothetical protein